jgi:RNA binding exosome subunit
VKGRFRGLHARAFVHATEDLDKVKMAMANVVGPVELTTLVTEGVHGNPLTVLEANVSGPDDVPRFFSKLDREDLHTILRTLDKRVDEGCNLFVKIDKQSAFLGQVRLDRGDDVISVRIRVAAFPARCELAQKVVSEIVEQELAGRDKQAKAGA